MTKVTEEEVQMVEESVTVYKCDRCGGFIGEDPPTDDVIINPRLRTSDSYLTRDGDEKTFREFGEWHKRSDVKSAETRSDDNMDWCKSCVNDVFYPHRLKSVPNSTSGRTIKLTILIILLVALALVFLL